MSVQNGPHSQLPEALYRAAEVRELDRLAIEGQGIPGYTLMCRAGAAAFGAFRERWPEARRVVTVCGGGNNGGDGYVVARLAQQAGLDSRALYLKEPDRLKGDALTAFEEARAAGVPAVPFEAAALDRADLIVDAMLGTGLDREVKPAWQAVIGAINAQPAGVLAIDIPSGLHADRGVVMGAAVRAELTVSFIGLKQGMFTGEGPACCGAILFDNLAVPAAIYDSVEPSSRLYQGGDLPAFLPPRPRTAHKGYYGHVLVAGGDYGMAGAVRMAAEAAARCGAGLVSVATRPEHAASHAAVRPELMFRGVKVEADLSSLLERATVVALGPGLGRADWGRSLWERVLRSDLPLVVDADGLNVLAENPVRRGDWVLTPHPGEAGRLLNVSPREVQEDRFAAVAQIVQRFGGVCVLKGVGSLIAGEEGPIFLCSAGNPGMASGGMGDVLTGIIAGLSAQGLRPLEAARAGVFIHACAGDLAAESQERGLLAMDLMPHLRRLVNP